MKKYSGIVMIVCLLALSVGLTYWSIDYESNRIFPISYEELEGLNYNYINDDGRSSTWSTNDWEKYKIVAEQLNQLEGKEYRELDNFDAMNNDFALELYLFYSYEKNLNRDCRLGQYYFYHDGTVCVQYGMNQPVRLYENEDFSSFVEFLKNNGLKI